MDDACLRRNDIGRTNGISAKRVCGHVLRSPLATPQYMDCGWNCFDGALPDTVRIAVATHHRRSDATTRRGGYPPVGTKGPPTISLSRAALRPLSETRGMVRRAAAASSAPCTSTSTEIWERCRQKLRTANPPCPHLLQHAAPQGDASSSRGDMSRQRPSRQPGQEQAWNSTFHLKHLSLPKHCAQMCKTLRPSMCATVNANECWLPALYRRLPPKAAWSV